MVLALACAGTAPAPQRTMEKGPKTPHVDGKFIPGPRIADAAALGAWLDAHPKELIRIPVVFKLGEYRKIESAHIGITGDLPPDAVQLKVNDSALGVALSDHIRRSCAEGPTTCVMWLEGHARQLMPMPDAAPGKRPFSVTWVMREAPVLDDDVTILVEAAP
jgi:hypothetical protein